MQVKQAHALVQATATNKKSLAAAIKGIEISGCTNLSGGLFQGISMQLQSRPVANGQPSLASELNGAPPTAPAEDWDMVERADDGSAAEANGKPTKTVRSVFLFTDGLPTDGIRDPQTMKGALKKLLAASGTDLKIHSFGFGSDHDPVLLQSISDAGNGTYYYVATEENIAEAFADALGGLLSVVAQNVELRITPTVGCTLSALDNGLQERYEGADLIISLADLYAEEAKDVVVIVVLTAIEGENASFGAASVCVSYMDIVNGELVERSMPLTLSRVAPPIPTVPPHPQVALHRARLATAAALRDAVFLADKGDNADAHALLCGQLQALHVDFTETASSELDDEFEAKHFLLRDLESCAELVKNAEVYRSSGSAYTRAACKRHAYQRSNALPMPPPTAAPKGKFVSKLHRRRGRAAAVAADDQCPVGAAMRVACDMPDELEGASALPLKQANLYATRNQAVLVSESKKHVTGETADT
jgi:hypothetical protein